MRDTVRRFARERAWPRLPPRPTGPTSSPCICGRRWATLFPRHHGERGPWRARHGSRPLRGAGGHPSRASASVGLSYSAPIPISASTRSSATVRRTEAALPAQARSASDGALAMSEPEVGLRCRVDEACGRGSGTTATFSTAARCGSPTAPTPSLPSFTPRPIPPPCCAKGITAFLIENHHERFHAVAHELDKLGMRGSNTCELVFTDCECLFENRLWRRGTGRAYPDVGPRLRARGAGGGAARHHGGLPRQRWCPMSMSASSSASPPARNSS